MTTPWPYPLWGRAFSLIYVTITREEPIMPAFVKTHADEKKWEKAKKAVGTDNWALVNHVYQKIKKYKEKKNGAKSSR